MFIREKGAMLIHGQYHWLPRRTGFRNDYCLGCDRPTRAIQIRTLDVWHLMFVALIPLGLWRRWHCSACGRRPGFNPKSRRKFVKAIAALGAAFAGVFWLMPVDEAQADMWWFFRIGGLVVALAMVVVLFRLPPDPSNRERLARVLPASDSTCPFCDVQLEVQLNPDRWRCPSCLVVRL
jgi:hypothetical protein